MKNRLLEKDKVYSVQEWLPFKKVLDNRCNCIFKLIY